MMPFCIVAFLRITRNKIVLILNSWFAHFSGGFEESLSENTRFCAIEHQPTLALAKGLGFNLKRFRRVGKEHRFISVFLPKVGNTIHFMPQNLSEP
jgi:hypothetical protein